MDLKREATRKPPFKNRRVRLVVLGVFQIIAGALFAVVAITGWGTAQRGLAGNWTGSGAAPERIGPAIVVSGLLAAWFIWVGIGSIRARRWARALILASSWLWLTYGVLFFVTVFDGVAPALRRMAYGLQISSAEIRASWVKAIAFLATVSIVLPGLLILLYRGRNVQATCQAKDPETSRTEECPLPVLALSLLAATAGLVLFGTGISVWTYSSVRAVSQGPWLAIVDLVLASVSFYAAWGLYQQDIKAWWASLLVVVGVTVSTTVAFSFATQVLSAKQVALLLQTAWPTFAPWALALVYLLCIRGYLVGRRDGGSIARAPVVLGRWLAAAHAATWSTCKPLLTRKTFIWAASVLGGLLLCGAIGYFALSPGFVLDKRLAGCEGRDSETTRGRKVTSDRHWYCLAQAAKEWSMPKYCEAIEPAEEKADCRSEVANRLGDMELCKRSGTAKATGRCLRAFAVRAEDPALCAQIQDAPGKDGCLAELAIATMRGELCLEITAEDRRADCATKVVARGGPITVCESIARQERRDSCYAGASKSPAACLKISPGKRAACWRQHQELLDDLSAACSGSPECLSKLSFVGTAACELIPDDQSTLRRDCFQGVFSGRSSWIRDSECARLGTQGSRDDCFAVLGRQAAHPGACLKVSDTKLRRACIMVAARNDAGRCLALNAAEEVKRCVAQSGFSTATDIGVCSHLPQERQSECATRVALNLDREINNAR